MEPNKQMIVPVSCGRGHSEALENLVMCGWGWTGDPNSGRSSSRDAVRRSGWTVPPEWSNGMCNRKDVCRGPWFKEDREVASGVWGEVRCLAVCG